MRPAAPCTSHASSWLFDDRSRSSEAVIIRRGTRSLGYGFVTFAKEADAVAAISKFDKTEVDGRQLSASSVVVVRAADAYVDVELAKPAAAKSGRAS